MGQRGHYRQRGNSYRGRGSRPPAGFRPKDNNALAICINLFTAGKCNNKQCGYSHSINGIGCIEGTTKDILTDMVLWNSKILTSNDDGKVTLWDCTSWKKITTIPIDVSVNTRSASSSTAWCLTLEQNWFFVGFSTPYSATNGVEAGYIKAWNLAHAEAPAYEILLSETAPYSHPRHVSSLAAAVDPNGNVLLFSGDEFGNITSWRYEITANRFIRSELLDAHPYALTKLLLANVSGEISLVSAYKDGTVKIWVSLASNARCVQSFTPANGGHKSQVSDMTTWLYRDMLYLITCGYDKMIMVWALAPPYNQIFKDDVGSVVTSITTINDPFNNPLLLAGLLDGSLLIKLLPSFDTKLWFRSISSGKTAGIRKIIPGPSNSFLLARSDCTIYALQITRNIAEEKKNESLQIR